MVDKKFHLCLQITRRICICGTRRSRSCNCHGNRPGQKNPPSVQFCLQLSSKQVGPGGVAISTPVEGGSARNGGIAIAGAQGVAIV